MKQTKLRDSNIELYRIIVMLMIVAHHYVVNSGLMSDIGPMYAAPTSLRTMFLLLFGAWGKAGINCFVLITGYFMCKSQITFKKFAKLLGEVMFYKVVFYGIFLAAGRIQFSLGGMFNALCPVINIGTGFTAAYLVFFLMIPFLNILIKGMNEKQHLLLLLLLSFMYILFGTLPMLSVTMNYVSWFSVLYFIAAYIRIYPKKIFSNTAFWAAATAVSALLAGLSVVVLSRINIAMAYSFVVDSNTLLAVMFGVSSFMLFKNIPIGCSKLINTVSATCYGVLLIHANSDEMRAWLWGDVLNNVGFYSSKYLVLHAVGSVVAVFVVCAVIDLLRIKLLEEPFFRLWDKRCGKAAEWFSEKGRKICSKLNIGD